MPAWHWWIGCWLRLQPAQLDLLHTLQLPRGKRAVVGDGRASAALLSSPYDEGIRNRHVRPILKRADGAADHNRRNAALAERGSDTQNKGATKPSQRHQSRYLA
jgi:hypothetical protein